MIKKYIKVKSGIYKNVIEEIGKTGYIEDYFEDLESGATVEFQIVEMAEEYFEALKEFEG